MSYDFNATYGPLKVYDQGQEGACWHYAHGLGVVAAQKMRGVDIGWTDPDAPVFTYSGSAWHGSIAGADHTVSAQQGSVSVNDPAAIKAYLDAAGFATMSVTQPSSINVFGCTSMPIIRPLAGDSATGGHDVVLVGYTDDGVIVQNSWGVDFGYRGRAIFSWAWLAAFAVEVVQESYDGFPLLGATKPPAHYVAPTANLIAAPAAPKESRMIIRFAGQPDVYEVIGSHLEHLTAQAYHARGNPAVTDLPADHPLAALPRTSGAA